MSKWSLDCVKKIEIDVADFIVRRMTTTPVIRTPNLYNAMLTANTEEHYQSASICVVNTESGWFLMSKCDKHRFETVVSRVTAMYHHCTEIERKLDGMRHNQL